LARPKTQKINFLKINKYIYIYIYICVCVCEERSNIYEGNLIIFYFNFRKLLVWKKVRLYQIGMAVHVVIAGFFCGEGKQEALDCWNNPQKIFFCCLWRLIHAWFAWTGDHPLQEYLAKKKTQKKKKEKKVAIIEIWKVFKWFSSF
jgi:hypothetical protein